MTKAEQVRLARWRMRVLRHFAETTQNVSQTCRYFGIPRKRFYKWKARYEQHGKWAYVTDPVLHGTRQGRPRKTWSAKFSICVKDIISVLGEFPTTYAGIMRFRSRPRRFTASCASTASTGCPQANYSTQNHGRLATTFLGATVAELRTQIRFTRDASGAPRLRVLGAE